MSMKINRFILKIFLVNLLFIIGANSVNAQESSKNLPTASVINEIRGHQLGLADRDLLESLRG